MSDDFFGPPPPQPEPEVHRQPSWIGPPENEIGEVVPIGFVLARTADVALAVRRLTAFSTGFSFGLTIRRRVSPAEHDDPFGRMRRVPGPDALRFGAQFSDGSKATTQGNPMWAAGGDDEPSGPIMMPRGGSGGDRSWDMEMWVWPLPPPGPLAFVAEWAAQSIPLTRHEVDAQEILQASERVQQLWPDDVAGASPMGGSIQIVGFAKPQPEPDQEHCPNKTGPGV